MENPGTYEEDVFIGDPLLKSNKRMPCLFFNREATGYGGRDPAALWFATLEISINDG